MKNSYPLSDERYDFILREYPDTQPVSPVQARSILGLAYLCLVQSGRIPKSRQLLTDDAAQALVDQAQELDLGY